MSKTEWLSAPGSPRNEAAERLRAMAPIDPYAPAWQAEVDRLLDEALAAERRATVERIREAANRCMEDGDFALALLDFDRILREEAAR